MINAQEILAMVLSLFIENKKEKLKGNPEIPLFLRLGRFYKKLIYK